MGRRGREEEGVLERERREERERESGIKGTSPSAQSFTEHRAERERERGT